MPFAGLVGNPNAEVGYGQGTLTGLDIEACIGQTGIVPHYCLPAI
ncbi:hypothetical protein [Natronospirillum operosum]|nr:hypothetical protein [Natronospirillum operosum]